ncbi:hypothetical protein C7457_1138 [Thermovibrio guaymasensis]|uniref:Tetratricopeptide repeat protein n=1 Tax=Thermovibrio guaymasensis TaxID=240167 RepID=A0A420W6J7_9BACT|nr:hypothetical protein [Thermovibrio guaymasensis]RKQ61696.1 hypothetical protein C7457_1138 [Thermovibrio guaymasensis]
MKRLVLAFFLIALSYPVMEKATSLQPKVEGDSKVYSYSYERLILTFPTLKPLISDVLYMQTCYLTGNDIFNQWRERKFSKEEWETNFHNVKVITKLDPYYFDPYYFTGSYILWRIKDKKEFLHEVNITLERGMKYIDDWRLPFFIGFNYFYFLGDKVKGAQYLKKASDMEGAPYYLKLLIPRLYAQSGKYQLAVIETAQELKRVKNEVLRKQLERRLKVLIYLRDLNLALEKFRKVYRRCPNSLDELVDKGFISKVPEDPYGGKFYVDRQKCTVWTTSNLRPVKSSTPSSQ